LVEHCGFRVYTKWNEGYDSAKFYNRPAVMEYLESQMPHRRLYKYIQSWWS